MTSLFNPNSNGMDEGENTFSYDPAGQQSGMQVIVFSSQKGGSGKTTLCGQLAVQAELAGAGPVAVIDTDPQGSLADWWNARIDERPLFAKTSVEFLGQNLEELRQMGIRLVMIDTQPSVKEVIGEIVKSADLVVIPTRPSPHDLRAVGATLDLVEKAGKPLVFTINCATRKAKITSQVAVALSQHGTVAPTTVHNRTDFATSMVNGKTVMETNPDGKSAEEMATLWEYLHVRLMRAKKVGDHVTFENSMGAANTAKAEQMPVPRIGFGRGNGFGRRQRPPSFGRAEGTEQAKAGWE